MRLHLFVGWSAVLIVSVAAIGLAAAFTPVAGIGLVVVALSLLGMSGRLWPEAKRRTSALTIAAALGLSFIALFPAFFLDYVISISAGLCGDETVYSRIAAVIAYGVVASWGLRSPARLMLASPLAVLAAVAVALLADYPFASAHAYCET